MKNVQTFAIFPLLPLLLAACGGGGSAPPVRTPSSVTFALTRTNVALPLPETDGYSCSVTIPPNSAPAGATLTVSVPAAGATLAAITTVNGIPTTTNPPLSAAVTATSSVDVGLSPALVLACTPEIPTIIFPGGQYVDPTNPGSYLPPNIAISENLAAGVPEVLGYL